MKQKRQRERGKYRKSCYLLKFSLLSWTQAEKREGGIVARDDVDDDDDVGGEKEWWLLAGCGNKFVQ